MKHKMKAEPRLLAELYEVLFEEWGPQYWWPGRTRFEMIVGAILTQNTAWTNVERAIRRLKAARACSPVALHAAPLSRVAEWIRPAGYFNVKARRLHAFTSLLAEDFGGSLNRLFQLDTPTLRTTLLSVNGIGPETADSILLYAAKRPQFVIDAYTRRFLFRHGWIEADADYDDLAAGFMNALPPDVHMYNEYHALIVRLAKTYCNTKPKCDACPLRRFLPEGGPVSRQARCP